ncbi:MAG TPA: thioesterase family protein [Acidimicrobiales bacterium]|nr:thioesterase family protein [Acidimicrobiales bacterium]
MTSSTTDVTVDGLFPRPLDQRLLGLEPHPDDPAALSFVIVPHLCRTDGRFYGGAALAAALAAGEAATGRPSLWSSTQLVASADQGERIRLGVDVVASGRSVDQVQVRGTVDGRLIFSSAGSTATPRAEGLHGTGQTMPRVPPPDDCGAWRGPRRPGDDGGNGGAASAFGWTEPPAVGHHLVSEHREAPLLDATGGSARPGHMALWARLTGDLAATTPAAPATPAVLGFLADMIPLAVARACGVAGAGTSLDNSLRIGDPAQPADGGWVLLELDAHVAVGGYGHGHVHLWAPDGRMLATGTQSARLFSIDDFVNRRAR